jgi:hypothetical protein
MKVQRMDIFANFPINRIAELTPTAWVARI